MRSPKAQYLLARILQIVGPLARRLLWWWWKIDINWWMWMWWMLRCQCRGIIYSGAAIMRGSRPPLLQVQCGAMPSFRQLFIFQAINSNVDPILWKNIKKTFFRPSCSSIKQKVNPNYTKKIRKSWKTRPKKSNFSMIVTFWKSSANMVAERVNESQAKYQ